MRRSIAWVALFAALVLTAGCLGLGDEGDEQELQKEGADVTEDTGGIEGLVTDPAVRPIAGANVTLVEAERSTTTADDGSFAFSRVEPGDKTLRVTAEDHVATVRTVSVTAGDVRQVDLVLAGAGDEQPYQQVLEMEGFIECGVGWRQDVVDVGQPLLQDSALAACAVPNLYLPGDNTTNDKFLHTFKLDPSLTEVVYELGWSADSGALTPALRSIMELDGFVNEGGARIMDARGDSPLRVHLAEEDWASLETNITEKCNDEDAGDDWCSVNPRANGWNMMLRVFATGDCQDAPAGACLVFQQDFTHYATAFYNQAAPQGFSLQE